MEEKTAKGIKKQLKRIADSLQRMEPKGEQETPEHIESQDNPVEFNEIGEPKAGDKVSF